MRVSATGERHLGMRAGLRGPEESEVLRCPPPSGSTGHASGSSSPPPRRSTWPPKGCSCEASRARRETEEVLMAERGEPRTWSRRKKDAVPRGIFRHESGVWATRFTCGAGHIHEQKVGPLKSETIRVYHERRARAHAEPGWCPVVERHQKRTEARAAQARRVTFRAYAKEYMAWAKLHHRGWRTAESRVKAMIDAFGDVLLDTLTHADIENFLDGLLAERSQSTRNRYRTLLHAMLSRAKRHGHLGGN